MASSRVARQANIVLKSVACPPFHAIKAWAPRPTVIPMSPKLKVVTWIVGIVAAYALSVGLGAYRITSAGMYPLATKGVAAYLVAKSPREANKPVYFKWWSSWYFRNSASDGLAQFLLCTSPADCHTVVAYVAFGKWQINVDGNLVNTDKWVVLPDGRLVNAEKPPGK